MEEYKRKKKKKTSILMVLINQFVQMFF